MKQAELWEPMEDDKVRCTACSWYCQIQPGTVGVCATRLNHKGKLYSLVYGQAIGLHLDPVEKKPLYHFLPGSQIFSFGTAGCNFGCLFCQNFTMSQINRDAELLERLSRAEDRVEKIKEAIARVSTPASPEEIVTMAVKQQADGIAYTYNEPAIFAEYAHDTMVRARKKGLKNIYVSNGFETEETFAYLKEYLDAINIDLKSFREEFYRKICFARLEPVKENIRRFFKSGIVTEVTTLIIPGHNDSTKELQEIAKFLAGISTDLPWHISAYHPAYKLTAPPTPLETLKQAYRIGKKAGLKYVYVGNVADRQHSQTRCPNCQALLIDRFGYQTEVDNLDVTKGKCRKCGEKIYGVFA